MYGPWNKVPDDFIAIISATDMLTFPPLFPRILDIYRPCIGLCQSLS